MRVFSTGRFGLRRHMGSTFSKHVENWEVGQQKIIPKNKKKKKKTGLIPQHRMFFCVFFCDFYISVYRRKIKTYS